ncbi:hypothetical protein RhiirB3_495423 [Rhizophagus irregularis]|nr:hypothetical protein RhiirB3_495423 [Rhizophagus irregularis]
MNAIQKSSVENEFFVPSAQNSNIYVVNSKIGTCTCPIGMTGVPCKHQGAVSVKFHISTFNFLPSLASNDRMIYAYIALGNLKKKNLKLEESHFEILRKEEISGLAFLDTTKEDFRSYGLKACPATTLAKFIEGLSQKLQNYSSLKTLDDLKEMLHRNKVNGKDITNIKQFTPSR